MQTSKNQKKTNSFILIGIVTLIGIIGLVMFFYNTTNSTKVLVTIDGKEYGTYSINKDQTFAINHYGEYNTIQIKDKTVSVIESNCDNQICVETYPLSKDFPGLIVCLPHGLVIELID